MIRLTPAVACLLLSLAQAAFAAAPTPGPPMTIQHVSGAITLDGDLGDPG